MMLKILNLLRPLTYLKHISAFSERLRRTEKKTLTSSDVIPLFCFHKLCMKILCDTRCGNYHKIFPIKGNLALIRERTTCFLFI